MRQLTAMPLTSPSTPAATPAAAIPRLRVGKLCVAIQAGSPAELIERAEAALGDSKFLEFRLDSLAKPAAALPQVKEFLTGHRDVTAIATCRRKEFGGNFAGSLTAELEVLLKAAEAGCAIVDLEVESAEEAKPAQLAKLRGRPGGGGRGAAGQLSRLYAHQGPGTGGGIASRRLHRIS